MAVQQKSIEQLVDELKESKKLGNLLLDNAEEVHYFYSMEGKLIYVNPAFHKMTGYTTEELYEKNFIPFVHPDDQEKTTKLWQQLFNGEYFEDAEYRIVRKDGEIRWNSSSWKVVHDAEGRKIGIQGKQQDISERKHIEEALRVSEERLRLLVEQANIHLWSVDSKLNFTQSIGGGLERLGLKPNEVVTAGYNLYQFFQTDSSEFQPIKAHIQAIAGNNVTYETNWQGRHFQTQLSPQKDEKDKIIGCIGFAMDDTHRYQTEEALRKSEERFRKLVEENPAGVRVATEGQIRYVNSAYLRMFGYDKDTDLAGSSFLDNIVPECRKKISEQVVRRFRGENVSSRYETIGLRLDGSQFSLEVEVYLLDLPDDQASVAFLTDLSERKQAEKALQRSEALERLATGSPLSEILTALIINAEKQNPEMLCSILLIDENGNHLSYALAPKLIEFYGHTVDGSQVSSQIISTNLAAYKGECLVVDDISSHPEWEQYRTAAKNAGLRSCWSEPIISSTENILGFVAVYYHEHRTPQQQDLDFIQDSARLAGIAIERKQTEVKTLELLEKNRELTQRLFQIQEQERRHLAGELHDEFSQWLTALRAHTQVLDQRCSVMSLDVFDTITTIEHISSQMQQSIRRMIHELRPPELDDLGLIDCLQELIDQWQLHYPQTHCTMKTEGNLDNINDSASVTAYRVIQESLTNVAKYADANNVLIQLHRNINETEDPDKLFITIKDDGKGINLSEPTAGFGILGMRERVLAAGGEFEITSSPGNGVHIKAQLPNTTKLEKTFNNVE